MVAEKVKCCALSSQVFSYPRVAAVCTCDINIVNLGWFKMNEFDRTLGLSFKPTVSQYKWEVLPFYGGGSSTLKSIKTSERIHNSAAIYFREISRLIGNIENAQKETWVITQLGHTPRLPERNRASLIII